MPPAGDLAGTPSGYNLARQVYASRAATKVAASTGGAAVAMPVLASAVAGTAPAVALEAGPPSGGRVRTFSALSNPHFRWLFAGNVMQFGAMQMQLLVRGVLVFQLTGSFAALGLVSLANAIPGLLFSLVGGVVADRAPKKSIIQTSQFLSGLNAAAVAALAFSGLLTFHYLLAAAVVQGATNAMMQPARQSIIPDLVPRDRLMNAIALNTSGQNMMQLIGPAAGGALIAFLSPGAVYVVMGTLYFLAVAFTFRLPKEPVYTMTTPFPGMRGGRRSGGVRDLVAGLRYVAQDRTVRMLIMVNFVIVLAAMPYTMMLPGFVREVLDKGPAEQGLMMSLAGVGALTGSLLVASLSGGNRGRLLLIFAALLGVALIMFAASSNYYLTLPIMLLIGVGQAGRMSMGQVLIQTYSADEYRGRVMAVWFMQFSLVQFGTFAVGIVSELIGPQLAIGGLAAIMLVTMLSVAAFVPSFRRLD
ncbi:MAG: MFS transporter [Dehalococcoidia bacterium]